MLKSVAGQGAKHAVQIAEAKHLQEKKFDVPDVPDNHNQDLENLQEQLHAMSARVGKLCR